MSPAYLDVIMLLHAAFAGVFFFLNAQSPSRFARLFAWSWVLEGFRAAILLPSIHEIGGWSEQWYCLSDILCFFANACLLSGCADLVSARLPRWLVPAYLATGIPLAILDRYWLPAFLGNHYNVSAPDALFVGIFTNLIVMFIPVATARLIITYWLFRMWKRTRLPGALIASLFAVPFAIVALAVPFQFYFSYSPDWLALVWYLRVLGFSISLVILMLDHQRVELSRSAASLASAQALAKLGNWETDIATQTSVWSDEMFRLYGLDSKSGIPTFGEFLQLMHPSDRAAFQANEARAIQERRGNLHEFRIIKSDGTIRWIRGHNTPQFGPNGEFVKMFGVEQDVTEQKCDELRMKLQHAVTQVLAEGHSLTATMRQILQIIGRALSAECAVFWTLERGTKILRCVEVWNTSSQELEAFLAATRKITFTEGVGLPGTVLASRQAIFISGSDMHGENFPRRDVAKSAGLNGGCAFPIALREEIFGVVEFFTKDARLADVEIIPLFSAIGTHIGQYIERQRLEEQYRQSQKMEAVGTLAGGIAHDFNNILTAISGYCELARLELPGEHSAHTHLQAVQQGATRATELVRQIMTFSRRQEQARRPLRLEVIVKEAIQLLRATIPATIEIKSDCAPDTPRILADATSIHQVLVNLGTNASHAMKGRSGVIEINVEGVDVCADFAEAHPGLREGKFVRLTLSDTGHGMSAATISRIFEPFFTTKPPGEGTGLGLSVVHGIVQAHEGAVFVYSQPGQGTKFQLYFPAHVCSDAEKTPATPAAIPRGNGQQVLYVEDEGPLGHMGRKLLERLNYSVEVHSNPATALGAFQTDPGSYSMVVTDLTMPTMTGLELGREIIKLRPGLPMILMTGYAGSLDPEQARADGFCELLLKPLSLETLGNAVDRALRGLVASR